MTAIRTARASDLEVALRLARECGVLETGIAEGLANFVVAELAGVVAGTWGLELHGRHGLLRSVVVAAPYRRKGIGRALVEEALRRARERNLRSVFLLTTTAARYFEGLGFEHAERSVAPPAIRGSWEFRTGCPASATFMRRVVRPDLAGD